MYPHYLLFHLARWLIYLSCIIEFDATDSPPMDSFVSEDTNRFENGVGGLLAAMDEEAIKLFIFRLSFSKTFLSGDVGRSGSGCAPGLCR